MPPLTTLNFEQRFRELGSNFFSDTQPTPLPDPSLVIVSPDAGAELGIDAAALSSPQFTELLTGNWLPQGLQPVASVYSGHQFGLWAGQLGDGRAHLLGETRDIHQQSIEWQLKGSGPTPYSRRGDGRAVSRSCIREFLASEAMHALRIPSTRALGVVTSPLWVMRESPEPSAMLLRTSPSHIRFGTFEHFANRGDIDSLRTLTDHVIRHFYPECTHLDDPVAGLLTRVAERTGRLIAAWQAYGFSHGVMNTDNMSILGLTLDYGPYGFMEAFDPGWVCNHSDSAGRYAFNQQPQVAYWNLSCLASALLPLSSETAVTQALDAYPTAYTNHYLQLMGGRLGVRLSGETDQPWLQQLFTLLSKHRIDYNNFFRELPVHSTHEVSSVLTLDLRNDPAWQSWFTAWEARNPYQTPALRKLHMDQVNPWIVLRNWLAQRAIRQAYEGDYQEVSILHNLLIQPFAAIKNPKDFANTATDERYLCEVSCSS